VTQRGYNQRMLEADHVPASQVAQHLAKPLSSIHRLFSAGYLAGARDGRALYIALPSLRKYYEGSTVMLAQVDVLEQWLRDTVKERAI
jgi:hypothetical protein